MHNTFRNICFLSIVGGLWYILIKILNSANEIACRESLDFAKLTFVKYSYQLFRRIKWRDFAKTNI